MASPTKFVSFSDKQITLGIKCKSDDILELCDLVEVISAILDYRNINGKEFEEMRSKKNKTNGKFKDKIFLNGVHRMS